MNGRHDGMSKSFTRLATQYGRTGRTLDRVPPEYLALAMVIVGDSPPLPGALCRGHPDTFDPHARMDRRRAEALTLCGRCPVLGECKAWVDRLPEWRRPVGVVGGQVRSERRGVSTATGRRRGRPPKHRTPA